MVFLNWLAVRGETKKSPVRGSAFRPLPQDGKLHPRCTEKMEDSGPGVE